MTLAECGALIKLKILITGGAGFIGSNLADKLVMLGHKVSVIDNLSGGNLKNLAKIRKKIKFYKLDISKYSNSLQKAFKDVEYVFHFAGLADIVPSIKNPERYFNNNVIGTLNILKAVDKKKIKKIIYSASASCYGFPKKLPIKEDSIIDTQYPYALTKFLGEKLMMHWFKVYNYPIVSLRFFNVYGPRSRTSGAYGAVFGVFLAQKLSNKPLTVVGNGRQTRDFIHVYDLVAALVLSMKKTKNGEIYNIGGGTEVSVNKIANIIGGKKIHIPKRPGEPNRTLADISKIKKTLNWKPKININDGIKDLINQIDYWKKAPIWTPLKIKRATKDWFKYLKDEK